MSTIFGLLLLQLACISIVSAGYNQTSSQTIQVVTRIVTIPQGYIHYPSIRAAFKVHSEEKDWSDAKKVCIAEGGRLAVIDTAEKLAFVKATKPRSSSVWVGIKQKKSHWVIADTEIRLPVLPWGSSQPNGVGDCAAVQKKGKGLYNRLCIWDQPFVCEIPIETTIYQMPCRN